MAIMEGTQYTPLKQGETSIMDSQGSCRLIHNEHSELWIVEFSVFGHAYDTHRNSFVNRHDAMEFMRKHLNLQDEYRRNLARHRFNMEEARVSGEPIVTATQQDADDNYLERIGHDYKQSPA